MLPPEPASPKPSANRKCDFGVTPRMVSPSDVMVIDPPPAVPPLTSTAFSRSIFPDGGTPSAVSRIVPPSRALAGVVFALSPLLDPPRSEMFPDATTEVPERRPAVIRIDPAVAATVLASALIAFEIDTSPSAFTVSEPAPAPLTSTGVAAAFVWTTNPPVPSVSGPMPPGPGGPTSPRPRCRRPPPAAPERRAGRAPPPPARASPALSHHADAALNERRHVHHHPGRPPVHGHHAQVVRAAVSAAVDDALPHHP